MENQEVTASFGYWVRRRRKALDLTQVALARSVSCATVTIVKIERDERRPSRQLAELLADNLAIPDGERSRFVAAGLGEYAADRLPLAQMPIAVGMNGDHKNGNGSGVAVVSHAVCVERPRLVNLPPQPTPFVGRTQELGDIVRRLSDPTCRLLTLIGPGGAGKSRLAVQAAQLMAESSATSFADGVCFVPLVSVESVDGVVAAIAAATRFAFYSDVLPRQQLLEYLGNKSLLLVLDNLEHLLPPAGVTPAPVESIWLIAEILEVAPDVTLLVTSRTAVHLQQAWYHPVDGMALPPTAVTDVDAWKAADAVQLFVQCGRRARVDFDLAPDYAGALGICRLVGGMPLTIELAANWLRMLSCAQIAAEIARGSDILATTMVNTPERHRSVRAVFEHSWQLLSYDERSALSRLSMLRGFSVESAEAVAGASPAILAALVDTSLVRPSVAGRYQIHELLRQFAAEKLAEMPLAMEATAERHSTYFLARVRAQEVRIKGAHQQDALKEIDTDIDNIHMAWLWAADAGRIDLIAPAVESLYDFHHMRNRYQEGEHLFSHTIEQMGSASVAATTTRALCCALLTDQGVFATELGRLAVAETLLRSALDTAQSLGMARETARCLHYLGEIAARTDRQAEADRYWQECLACCQRAEDHAGMADVLQTLAQYATYRGEYLVAKRYAMASLEFSRPLGRPDAIAYALDKLGYVASYLGEFAEAEQACREGYALSRSIGDQLGMSLCSGGVALVLSTRGQGARDEAFATIEESLALAVAIGHRVHIATRLVTYGRVANNFGEYQRTLDVNRRGLEMAESIGSASIGQLALSDLGYAYCQLGDFAAARHAFAAALENGESSPSFVLTMALVHYGILRMTEGRRLEGDAATDALGSALQLFIFAGRQPMITHEFREKAAHYQNVLESELPPKVVALAYMRVEGMTPTDIRNELL